MSGISPSTKVTPLTYLFNGVVSTVKGVDADEDNLANALSSAKAKLVNHLVEQQKAAFAATGERQDAHILFLDHVYVVRAANAKCEKITGPEAKRLKKLLKA